MAKVILFVQENRLWNVCHFAQRRRWSIDTTFKSSINNLHNIHQRPTRWPL